MNWIKKFNEIEKETVNELLDLICEHEKIKETRLNNCFVKIFEIIHELDHINIQKLTPKELRLKVSELMGKYNDITQQNEEDTIFINDNFHNLCIELDRLLRNLKEESYKMIRNSREEQLLKKRVVLFANKIVTMTISLDTLKTRDMSIFEDIKKELDVLTKISINRKSLEDKELQEFENHISENKLQYEKIFHFQKLCDIAEKEGYFHDRTSGDHLIYKHKKTGKIVPIVRDTELAFGTMRNIQKMIQVNSVV